MVAEQAYIHDALLESTKEIFETMVFMGISEATETNQEVEGWALLGSITFKGDIEGCLAICCSAPCAQAIAVNMLGLETPDELNEEGTCDAVGEIANMVMGGVKSRLLKTIGNLEVSIPSVVSGRGLKNNLGDKAVKISSKVNIDEKYTAELILLYREKSK